MFFVCIFVGLSNKDFIKAVYAADDPPVEPQVSLATNVSASLQLVQQRSSNKALKPDVQKHVQASGSSPLEASLVALSQLSQIQSLLDLAKKMDQKKTDLHHDGSGLVSKDTGDSLPVLNRCSSTISLVNTNCCRKPPATQPSSTPPSVPKGGETPPETESCPEDQKSKVDDDYQPKPKSLEEYEEQAFAAIKKMKRPAACASTVAKIPTPCSGATEKPKAAAKAKTAKLTCFGCSRCRGNPLGCPSCAFHGFQGKRLNGRKAWQTWWHQQQSQEKKVTKVKKSTK